MSAEGETVDAGSSSGRGAGKSDNEFKLPGNMTAWDLSENTMSDREVKKRLDEMHRIAKITDPTWKTYHRNVILTYLINNDASVRGRYDVVEDMGSGYTFRAKIIPEVLGPDIRRFFMNPGIAVICNGIIVQQNMGPKLAARWGINDVRKGVYCTENSKNLPNLSIEDKSVVLYVRQEKVSKSEKFVQVNSHVRVDDFRRSTAGTSASDHDHARLPVNNPDLF